MSKKVVIIGGAGEVGKLYADMFQRNDYTVGIIDPSSKAYNLVNDKGYYLSDKDDIQSADVVVFSVPIKDTIHTIEDYGGLIKPGALAMDVTSVKKLPMVAMCDYLNDDVSIVGTHPMFRPDLSFEKQHVVLTPERINDHEIYKSIVDMFKSEGAKTIITTADEHDKCMAVVQVLMHDEAYSVASTIQSFGNQFSVKLSDLEAFSSPLYRATMDFSTYRVLSGSNTELYASILKFNPYTIELLEHVEKNITKLKSLVKNGKLEDIIQYIDDLKTYVAAYSKQANERASAMVGEELRGVEIYYREEHEQKIIDVIGEENKDDIDIMMYKLAKKMDRQTRSPIGSIKKMRIKNDGLASRLKFPIVVARETRFGSEEFYGDGRDIFLIENHEFVKTVLNDSDFVESVLLDGPVISSDYKAIQFDEKPRTSTVHPNRYRVVMKNNIVTDPILNFFDTVVLDNWENIFGPMIVFRGQKRVREKAKKNKK